MRWRYDQRLIEAVIFQEVQRLDAGKPDGLAGRYHRVMGPLYDLAEADGREQAFFDAHWRLFGELGFDRLFAESLERFPRVAARVPEGLVARVASAREEGAELFARDGAPTTVVLRLRPERFLDREGLGVFSRHELCHIDDLLDPAFAYRRDDLASLTGSVEAQVTRERYRVLWTVSVDGRLAQAGLAPLKDRDARFEELTRTFPFLEETVAAAWFEELWQGTRPSHPRLLQMARHSRGAMASGSRQGLPCPLCAFPSHAWVESAALSDGVRRQIQAEFPSWVASEGMCGRCAEVYTVAQGTASDGSLR